LGIASRPPATGSTTSTPSPFSEASDNSSSLLRSRRLYCRVKFEKPDLIYYSDIRLWFTNVLSVKVENSGDYLMAG